MRIKRGLAKRRRHNKVLKAVKGFRLSYSKLYRRAKEALLHAGNYSFNDRKKRAGEFRKLWIQRINAALKPHNIKYSVFIKKLSTAKVDINRKMLAELATNNIEAFNAVVEKVK